MATKVRHPLVVVVGETASGKSHLALQLAQLFGGEIICCDSATIRRQLDIGTAKPTLQERSLAPHHMLDIVEPDELFTVANFKILAEVTIEAVYDRHRLPIMVGGSGLYIDSILYDYSFLPTSDQKDLDKLSNDELLYKAKSAGLDVSQIDYKNKRRLIRFIETGGKAASKNQLRGDTLIIGLKTTKEDMKQNIQNRIDKMIKDGLEEEVKGIVQAYGWDCPALKNVGYSQWKGYFENNKSLLETKDLIAKATINLAKRQRTWFKRNKSIHWINTPVKTSEVVELVTTYLSA